MNLFHLHATIASPLQRASCFVGLVVLSLSILIEPHSADAQGLGSNTQVDALPSIGSRSVQPTQQPLASIPTTQQEAAFPIIPLPILGQTVPNADPVGQWVATRRNVGFRNVFVGAEDDIWLVSARAEPEPASCSIPLKFSQLQQGTFLDRKPEDLQTVYQLDRTKRTLIYVHGNRTDLEYAKSRALQMYDNLFGKRDANGCIQPRPPIRLIIFAWRSESEINRIVPDFKLKSERSLAVADSFRQLIQQFPDRNPILMGYSLGAQIVLKGAMDEGCLSERPGQYQVVLIAASLNPKFVEHGLASLPQAQSIARTTVFLNRSDFAIRTSNRFLNVSADNMDPLEQVTAVENAPNSVQIVDITKEASRCHSIVKYTGDSVALQAFVRDLVGSQPQPTQAELASKAATTSVKTQAGKTQAGKVETGKTQTARRLESVNSK